MFVDLLHTGSERRDYLFFLAVAEHRLHNDGTARRHLVALLQDQPENRQARELLAQVEARLETGMCVKEFI